MKYTLLLTASFLFQQVNQGFAQAVTDTVIIDASNVNTKVLIPGTHRYLVYAKNGKDSSRKNFNIWTRKIDFISYKGKDAISVTQEWEDNVRIINKVYSVCDKKTFAPLYHESAAMAGMGVKLDYETKILEFNDSPENLAKVNSDTAFKRMYETFKKRSYAVFESVSGQPTLNWNLDLEVFPTLPFKINTTFLINFYDPGLAPPKMEAYTVNGEDILTGYNGEKIACWLLVHGGGPGKSEVFWISKKTKEVLKLEQESNGKFRYKIKMGFSI